jgi:guanylate kinase
MYRHPALHEAPRPSTDRIFLLESPSGAGKTTGATAMRARFPERLGQTTSFTTRAPRPGEETPDASGKLPYLFGTRADFERLHAEGAFLEFADVYGSIYGTRLSEVSSVFAEGKSVLREMDIQGIAKARASNMAGLVRVIHIMAPSGIANVTRLVGRGTEAPEKLYTRLEVGQLEIEAAKAADYVIVNREIEQMVTDLTRIVDAETGRSPSADLSDLQPARMPWLPAACDSQRATFATVLEAWRSPTEPFPTEFVRLLAERRPTSSVDDFRRHDQSAPHPLPRGATPRATTR